VEQAEKPKAVGAAALLAVAQRQLNQSDFAAASEYASEASKRAPTLDDYANYVRAQAEYKLRHYGEVDKAVAHVFTHNPVSPLTGAAAALAVQSSLDGDKPKSALDMIRKYYKRIPQPQADFLLAQCFQATGDLPQAAAYFQRVYYNYPKSQGAKKAEEYLSDLKTRLAENYPPPMPTAMLARAMKLIDARDYPAARDELKAAIPQLGGTQLELARVRLGEVDFLNRDYKVAKEYLGGLQVNDPEADAERLDYLIRSILKIDSNADVKPYLQTLGVKYPQSKWRLDVLMTVANLALVQNDAKTFMPLFSACAASFPTDEGAERCHWRVAFENYRRHEAGAVDLLRAFLTNFPESDDANASLYYLARLSESKDDDRAARAYFDAILDHYPNTYYALQARERLKRKQLHAAEPSPPVLEFLRGIAWPQRRRLASLEPDRDTQKRLERARLLRLAQLDQWAETELTFGAKNDGNQPYVYAYELAKLASQRGDADQAIRYIKAYAPGYLRLMPNDVPPAFWRMAFPMPYRPAILRYSRAQKIDPFLVCALIRQESEFNPKAISYANAYGLMQVRPATGRDLARQLRIRHFTTHQLLTPDRNVQLGTKYFRWLLDSLGDHPEEALAAFNAGKSRVDLWSTWGPYSEPAEFIETIPFTQTREYVQVVLRNAEVYQRLYEGLPALDGAEAPVHKTTVRKKSVVKKPAAKKPAGGTTRRKR
jgi:soluble lytic murein transglycosylase